MTSQANIESSHVNCGFPLISFVTASSKKEYLCMGCLLKDLITNRGSESEKIDILEKVIFGLRATYNIEKSYSDREESVIVGKKFFESLVQAAKVNLHSEAKSDRLVGFFGRAFVVAFCHKFTKKEDVIDLCCQYVIELFERKKAEEESCFLRLIVCVIEKMAEWMNTRKMLFFGPGLENKGYIKCFVFCLLPQLLMISQMAFTSLGVINNFVKAVKLASTIETKDTDFKNNFRKFVDDIIPCVSKYIVSMPNPKVRKNSLSK